MEIISAQAPEKQWWIKLYTAKHILYSKKYTEMSKAKAIEKHEDTSSTWRLWCWQPQKKKYWKYPTYSHVNKDLHSNGLVTSVPIIHTRIQLSSKFAKHGKDKEDTLKKS